MHISQSGVAPVEELITDQSSKPTLNNTEAINPAHVHFLEDTQEQSEEVQFQQDFLDSTPPTPVPSSTSINDEPGTLERHLTRKSVAFDVAASSEELSQNSWPPTPYPRRSIRLPDVPTTPRRSLRLQQSAQSTPRRSKRIQLLQEMTASKRTPTPRKRDTSKRSMTSSARKRKATQPLTPANSAKKSRRNLSRSRSQISTN